MLNKYYHKIGERNYDERSWRDAIKKSQRFMSDMSEESIKAYWDNVAKHVSRKFLTGFMNEVIDLLFQKDILRANSSVLDVGCGPGSFGLEIARRVERVLCADFTRGMLDIVNERCTEAGICNVDTVLMDWNKDALEEKFDVVFSSMCPATNSPESIIKMEEHSSRCCVHVSKIGLNMSELISAAVWKELGMDSRNAGDGRFVLNYLIDNGRDAQMDIIKRPKKYTMTRTELFNRTKESFAIRGYAEDADIDNVIEKIIDTVGSGEVVEIDDTTDVSIVSWHKP